MRRVALLVTVVVALAACSPGASDPAPDPDALQVVATTTVLADLVAQVGGTNVNVTSIVPKGGVVETFDPSPRDVAALGDAELIVMNGLGLDAWLEPVIEAAAPNVPVVRLGEDLDGAQYVRNDAGGGVNPHLWLDVINARAYARRLVEAIADADPTRAPDVRASGEAYMERLAELDRWVLLQISSIPPDRRKLVSFHEAFPYFANAYGLEIIGSVIGVPGQDPSAGEVAALVDAIRSSGAKAVFTEAQFNPELAEAIAEEAGVTVESDLYNDSLGDPPVDTYEGLIRWDTEKVVRALGGTVTPS